MILRRIEESDLSTRVEWVNNPLIYKTMNIPVPITLDGTKVWFDKIRTVEMRFDFVLEENGKLLAMTGLIPLEQESSHESYTFVNPELLGQGFGTLAKFLALVYGFQVADINKVKSIIDEDNYSSIKVYKKLGFELFEVIENGIEKNGVKKDRHIFYCNEKQFKKTLYQYEVYKNTIHHTGTM